MAKSLEYEVPPAPRPGAEDELRHLIEVLHTSGALRTLTGFFGKLGKVSDVAMTEANTDPGRNLIGSLLFVGELLTKLPAEDLASLAHGLEKGVKRAKRVGHQPPPSLWGIFKMARQPETRRTLAALLTVVSSVGEEMAVQGQKSKT